VDPALLSLLGEVLAVVRRAKSEAHVSMRTPVDHCVVRGPAAQLSLLESAAGDLRDAGVIGELEFVPGSDAISVEVTLGEALSARQDR
jgi:valyl-tRNA synthetase